MASAAEPALTVFAWGNSSRADDGVGPILAERLRALGLDTIEVIEDMQLQIEHTTDIHARVPVLFIDASLAIDSGFGLQAVRPLPDHSITTHAVSPAALLQLYETSTGRASPPAWQLHVAARHFELGETPGERCLAAIDAAWQFLDAVLRAPADTWQAALAAAGEPYPKTG